VERRERECRWKNCRKKRGSSLSNWGVRGSKPGKQDSTPNWIEGWGGEVSTEPGREGSYTDQD